jgi:hypothetical protein
MKFIQDLGVYPPSRVFANLLLCVHARIGILHAGESVNALNIFFSRAAFEIKKCRGDLLCPLAAEKEWYLL